MTTQGAVLELFPGGVWTAVPLYSTGTGVTVTRGQEAGGTWPKPTKIDCEINNDTLAYDPSRPESTLYGVAGRNTRARIKINGTVRVWAEASSWQPDRTPEHVPSANKGRSWTRLAAEGVLRRIGKWTDPLRSPMYRTIAGRPTSIGHWPLEDGRDSLTLANTSGGTAGTFKGGATLAESDAPLGAEQTVKVATASQLAGRFDTASTTAGWQVAFSFRLPAMPPSATYGRLLRWQTSNGYIWAVDVNNAFYQFTVTDSAGTTLWNIASAFGAGAEPNQWVTLRVRAVQSGGNVDVQPAWYPQGAVVSYGISDLFAGSVGGLRQWWQDGNAVVADAHFSHVFGVTGVSDVLNSATALNVFNGYLGELAADRFLRLCTELGITRYAIGVSPDTQRMGPQRAATFLDLLKEIRDTDDCRIDDERFDIALTLRTRRVMYNQTAALTLTYPSQVAIPFSRILDDLDSHNVVTVKNASGGEVTSSLTAGRMSVQPPPAGIGEYKHTVDVNVANPSAQLGDIADWHRAKGTLERSRYDEVTVNLLANPGLAAAATAVREGDMIAVVGKEPDPVRFLVCGIVEKVGAVEWTITYLVELYDVWIIGVYDDGIWRWDTRTTTLAAGATATATTLSLTTVDSNDVLTTAAGSIPYDLMVEGERVRVTAMTAPGNRNTNTDFETGVADWTGFGGGIVQTNFAPHQGLFCLKLTPDGVSSTTRIECGQVPGASPGQSWQADAWVKCEVARNVTANINWFDSSGNYLSTTNGAATPVAAFTWTPITVAGPAPASAARVSLSIDMSGTPPVTHILYVDEAAVQPAGAGPYAQTATVIRSINGVIKAQTVGGLVNVYDSRRWGL